MKKRRVKSTIDIYRLLLNYKRLKREKDEKVQRRRVKLRIDTYLDQKMALLVFEGRGHEKRQNLVEQRASSEFSRFVCNL